MKQNNDSTGITKRLKPSHGFPHFIETAKSTSKLSFEQEVALKRVKIFDSGNQKELIIFDNPPPKVSQKKSFSGYQGSKECEPAIVLSSISNTRSKNAHIIPNEVAEQEANIKPGEVDNINIKEPSSEVPLVRQIAFLFDRIFSSEYAQIFLKHHTDKSDLGDLELALYRKPLSLKEVFDSLYLLINTHESELLKTYSIKSKYYQRCEHFRAFLSSLKREFTSYCASYGIDADCKSICAYIDKVSPYNGIILTVQSDLYYLRIGSNKPFQLPDYDVETPVLNLHLPVLNWLEKKLLSGAFKGDEGAIKQLDSGLTTIARIYVMGNRAMIQTCLDDTSSVVLLHVTMNLQAKVNHFLLFVRPFGEQRKMEINSRGDLDGYPKSWFWGKIVKCLLLDQDYQVHRGSYKPLHIGNLDSEITSHFTPLVELFKQYI